MSEQRSPKRALIMAGGGLKVAFQAGVLQVWMDETLMESGERPDFQLADGASGGVFNLAMWCQGYSGTEIANRWRGVRPLKSLSVNAKHWFPRFESLLTYERFRKVVFEDTWDLDWGVIRSRTAGRKGATFNLFNFSQQRQVVLTESAMDPDALVSAASLPFWFPSVRRNDGQYIDAVYATDANLEAAIAAGADELWIVWTESQRGIWRPGPINLYFQAIEASANSRIRDDLERIARNNAQEAEREGCGEFGRPIKVRWLAAEVPLHYLFNFTQGGMQDAVNRGITAGRRWVRNEPGITLDPATQPPVAPPSAPRDATSLGFSEYFEGTFVLGESDPFVGAEANGLPSQRVHISLRAEIDDLDAFVRAANHPASLCATVDIPTYGAKQRNVPGEFQVFSDQGDFRLKQLVYLLRICDGNGLPKTLVARKYVPHQDPKVKDPAIYSPQGLRANADDPLTGAVPPRGIWVDTTTLYMWIVDGHVTFDQIGTIDTPRAAGIMRVTPFAFLRSLASTRTSPVVPGLRTYATFFGRQLWQAYRGVAVPPTQPPALAWLNP